MGSDSDSDDDRMLPNEASMNNLFFSVHQQVRQESAALAAKEKATKCSNKNDSTKSTPKPTLSKKDQSDTAKASSSTSPEEPDTLLDTSRLSEETKRLLAEVAALQLPPLELEASRSTSTVKSKTCRSAEETNARKRRKKDVEVEKKEVICVSLDDDDDVDGDVSTQEILLEEMEELSDIKVEPVEVPQSVRIRWKGEILRFSFPLKTKVSQVRMETGRRLKMRADDLILFDENTSEEISDLQLVEQLPLFGILDAFERVAEKDPNKLGPNFIPVQIQGCGGYRKRLTVTIQRTTPVSQLVDDYVEKFGLHGKNFKLIFDGDRVELDQTVASLDLDGGEMFDIVEIP